jgi:hypothetical protein
MIHGTVTAYRTNGCRCFLCKKAHSEATAAYRKEKPQKAKPKPKVKSKKIEFEEWCLILNQYLVRKKSWTDIEKYTGIFSFTISSAFRKRASIQVATFEKLKSGLEVLVTESEEKKANQQEERVFRRRWQEVFRFLYKGGFTPETLAERLEIPLIRLQRFIDADYQDDNRLAMRIAQLRWVMIQGEAKDDDGQS